MATLTIHNLPEPVRARVEAMAERDNRTVEGELVAIIARAAHEDELMERRRAALESMERRAKEKPPLPIDSLTLLREDRER